jgi:hypothetical protein
MIESGGFLMENNFLVARFEFLASSEIVGLIL